MFLIVFYFMFAHKYRSDKMIFNTICYLAFSGNKSVRNKKIILYLLSVCFTLIFLFSAIGKISDMAGFSRALSSLYYGLPYIFYNIIARSFVCCELVIGLAILTKQTRIATSWAIVVLTWLFVLVHVRIMLFFPNTDCHCFGRLFDRPATWRTLCENILLFLAALALLRLAYSERKTVNAVKG